ncbi:uncharacterized protein BO87DRAFT_315853 [Aspergillus neoniger CBS 115656]|uniref:Uncharacterized protein n=1 Tax=Aspergillus neoniger (strain CBS 115656) TaxID=1448310 RepID=A0A318Z1V4_ASPNB|nr:hypothetical protein BO87DRAFT_315853 [Aspergillus neoniger CBS 115656]PYH31062.1 hypothetical protein BO87DRAFT_315853 [Aspergillus neoniger CBS 115656]
MLPCFWSRNRKTTHGVTAWKTALGSVFTASCPPFASCYVLLPTLYLVPVRFPIPRCGLVLLLFIRLRYNFFIFFCLLYTILVRSPTPDHLFIFWTFFLVPLLFLCASCQSEVLLKSERYDNGSGRCMSEESKTKLEVLRWVVMYCTMAIWVRQQRSLFDERRIQ